MRIQGVKNRFINPTLRIHGSSDVVVVVVFFLLLFDFEYGNYYLEQE